MGIQIDGYRNQYFNKVIPYYVKHLLDFEPSRMEQYKTLYLISKYNQPMPNTISNFKRTTSFPFAGLTVFKFEKN